MAAGPLKLTQSEAAKNDLRQPTKCPCINQLLTGKRKQKNNIASEPCREAIHGCCAANIERTGLVK